MTFEELKKICLALSETTVDYPFDQTTAAFRTGNKIFALCPTNTFPLRVNLKCDPALAGDLRASYPEIIPGWHMNKTHWNTVNLEGSLDNEFIKYLIEHSHSLVHLKREKKRSRTDLDSGIPRN